MYIVHALNDCWARGGSLRLCGCVVPLVLIRSIATVVKKRLGLVCGFWFCVVLFWVCFGGMSCLCLSGWVDEWLTYGEGKVLHLFGGERHFDVLIAVFVRGKGGEYCYKADWESFGVSRECDLLWSCSCCSRSRNAVLRRQTLRGSCLKVSADVEASEEE